MKMVTLNGLKIVFKRENFQERERERVSKCPRVHPKRIHPRENPSIQEGIHPSIHPKENPSIHPSKRESIHPSKRESIHPSKRESIQERIHPRENPSKREYPKVHLKEYPRV